jgi:pimeloyl-ACP methyl ester carboxylesterase
MRPVLLPLVEQAARLALRQRGVSSRWVSTPHGRVHAYEARGYGALPTTVLLHGIGSAATPFGAVLGQLQGPMRRVVAPDYLGHGFSDGRSSPLTPQALFESVSETIESLVDEPAILVGNSLGGAVALKYAIARPERVRALVLVSPAGAPASDEEWLRIKAAFDLSSRANVLAFLARIYHRPPWFLPLLAHELPAALGRRPVRSLLDAAYEECVSSPQALQSLKMPILLLWGRGERLLPDSHLEFFSRHLPEHTLIERPEGFGHAPHFDAPDLLAQRILNFARSLSEGSRS